MSLKRPIRNGSEFNVGKSKVFVLKKHQRGSCEKVKSRGVVDRTLD